MKRIGDILTRNKTPVTRLGDHIREESHPVGKEAAKFHLVGVSNELGLVPSPRESAADDLSRYQRVKRDWFAYNPMRVNVGSIGLADADGKTGITSPDYVVFSCRDSLDPRYLLHFLKSDYGLEAIAQQCSGAVRKRLYYSGLAEIELPIPSIQRQREVVAHIESIQNAVTFIRGELSRGQTLAKLKQAILQEAIQGKLTADWRSAHPDVEPASHLLQRIQAEKARLIAAKKLRPEKPLPNISPDEIPFEIPNGWEWCRFGSYARFERGKFSARPRNDKRFFGGPYPFIQIGSLDEHGSVITSSSQTLNEAGLKVSRIFEAGTIAIAIVGGTIGNLGVLGRDMCFTDSVVGVRPSDLTCQDFILMMLRAKQPEIQAVAYQRAGQPNISLPNLTDIPIPLPPLAEQAAIVSRVEALMTTCRLLEAEIEHARTHAAHLLQAVLKEAFAP